MTYINTYFMSLEISEELLERIRLAMRANDCDYMICKACALHEICDKEDKDEHTIDTIARE